MRGIRVEERDERWSRGQNGDAERLLRTIREEEVDLSDYEDYHDVRRQLGQLLDEVYMQKRINSSLGYLTPAEFESQWYAEQSTEWVIQQAMPACLLSCCSAQVQPQPNRSVAKITLAAKAILEEEQ